MLILLLLLLIGCQTKELHQFTSTQMQMQLIVQVDGKEGVEDIIKETFEEVDQIYNNWNPNSEISIFNRSAASTPIHLSPQLSKLLHLVDKIVTLTQGRFDPTVDPLQKLWKCALVNGRTPNENELSIAADSVGWNKIHLIGDLIFKENKDTTIDLSGIAKGYAVDLLALKLQEAGFKHILVDWAGELRAIGAHPRKRAWTIAILGGERVELQDESIATSGSYRQQWEIDGSRYTHLIDPFCKKPLESCPITSASVALADCATADAIATALMLFNSKLEAQAWFNEHFPEGRIWAIETSSWLDPSPVSSLFP